MFIKKEGIMNRWLLRVVLLIAVLTVVWSVGMAQKAVTIPQLQQIPLDSLKKLDTLQNLSAGLNLDKSPNWHLSNTLADTVNITGVVIVKPGVLTYTLARYNIFIQDTTTGQVFAGINVLTNDTSTQAQSTGFTALDTGMVVTLAGRVTEFGSSSQNNSLTELFHYTVSAPIYTSPPPISIGTIIPRPAPREVAVSELANGSLPHPSTAEKYESMYIVVRNVTVTSVDYNTGRFSFADSVGNTGYMYDGSQWYTLRGHKVSSSRYAPPPVGTKLAYLRGVVLPQTRSLTCGDYTVMPLYPGPSQQSGSKYAGDILVSSFSPQITGIDRTPGVPRPTDAVTVSWKAKNLNAGGKIDSSFFNWSFGSNSARKWVRSAKLTPTSGDSMYTATIPAANGDSLVSYYVEAYGGGVYGASPDPTVPNFYQIRQNGLSIKDIQFTPFAGGIGPFLGDTVTVSGVITADTTDIKQPISNIPRLWMASAAGAWNGIAIWGSTAGVRIDTMRRGDSLQVTGIVDERGVSSNDRRTSIGVLSYNFVRRGVTVPAATTISMSGSGSVSYQDANRPVKGATVFEQWESVLIKTPTVFVNMLNADNSATGSTSNFGEFFVSTTKGATTLAFGIRVNDDGTNAFYCDTTVAYQTAWASAHPFSPPKKKLIPVAASIGSLTAIMTYSNGEYKLEPRKDDDFGIISAVYRDPAVVPTSFELSQNYPNPFNPTTTIRYYVPKAGGVTLKVYNMLGQEVMTLVNGHQNAGAYVVVFDASRLSSGVYLYQMTSENFSSVKKMMLLK